MDDRNQHDSRLAHDTSSHVTYLYGVPRSLFIFEVMICVITAVTLHYVFGLVLFIVVVLPTIKIHEHDEKALTFLLANLARPAFYSSGVSIDQSFNVLKRMPDDTYIVVSPLNSKKIST